MTPLLLLVDFQHDYLGAPGLEPAAGQMVERTATLLEGCRTAGIPVVHVWTTVSRVGDQRMPHWKRLGKRICEEGTSGHAPPVSLLPAPGEVVVHKRFFSAFSSGTLAPMLVAHRVDTLIIAGIHLHACVRETILDAYEQGFEVLVADDAVGSDDPLHAAITRRYLQSRAARFTSVTELLNHLRGAKAEAPTVSQPSLPPMTNSAAEDVRGAVMRAREAWPTWTGSEPSARRELLRRIAVLLEQQAPLFAEQMAREIGKPVAYGRVEVERTGALLREIARQDLDWHDAGAAMAMRRRPVGVIAVITPWNNPFLIPLGKIAAAIFHGNTVVWKPAPAAAALAEELVKCLRAAGCPEGVVTMVQGDQRCGANLMSDPRIDAVTLTGGALAGYGAQEICARRHIPLQAELGGNNAAIVWPDADLSGAAMRIAEGAFGQAGQRCTANRRVIVHQECFEAFLTLLASAVAALPWGNPLDPATRVGPLVSVSQRDRVAALLARAAPKAGRILVPHGDDGATFHESRFAGAYHPPTIVCCDDPGQEIVQEETFGPVLVVQRADDWAQAIGLCNGVRQGLVAAIFTGSAECQRRFLGEAQAGVLKINQATADVAVHLPFGGWKASGVGPPEHGAADREFYARIQAVYQSTPAV
jgi:acyl-CoA reductase-like NAD-dependent aldehyde dehydrogenase/nicotinamidase-related amidase